MRFTLFYQKSTAAYYVYSYNSEYPNAFMYISKSRFSGDTPPQKLVVYIKANSSSDETPIVGLPDWV